MTNTPDRQDFWGNVHWLTVEGEHSQWASRTRNSLLLPAIVIVGIAALGVWLILRNAHRPLGPLPYAGIAGLVLFAAWVIQKAVREWLALDKPLDAYGRADPGYEGKEAPVPLVFFGHKFILNPSPPSDEPLNLRDIMNGAPGVGLASLVSMFCLMLVGVLIARFTGSIDPADMWTIYAAGAAVCIAAALWDNWYIGGSVTPGRIEVWHWWPGLTRVYTPQDSVLHVVIDSQVLRFEWGARSRRRSWAQDACLRRQTRKPSFAPPAPFSLLVPGSPASPPLAIMVQVVRRGSARPFTLARWCDPCSQELARLLALWVDLPIEDGQPFTGSQGGAGVFTPVHPDAAELPPTGSSS